MGKNKKGGLEHKGHVWWPRKSIGVKKDFFPALRKEGKSEDQVVPRGMKRKILAGEFIELFIFGLGKQKKKN